MLLFLRPNRCNTPLSSFLCALVLGLGVWLINCSYASAQEDSYQCNSIGAEELKKIEEASEPATPGIPSSILTFLNSATPPAPEIRGPEDNSLVNAINARLITAPGRSEYLFLEWGQAPVLPGPGIRNWALSPVTHYKICVYHDNGNITSADASNFCKEGVTAEQGQYLLTAVRACTRQRYRLIGSAAIKEQLTGRLKRVRWVVAACNHKHCSSWSKSRRLRFLPPPKLISPNHNAQFASWPSMGVVLRADHVADADKNFKFCIVAFPGTSSSCPSDQTIMMNQSPYVVNVEDMGSSSIAIRIFSDVRDGKSNEVEANCGTVPCPAWYRGQYVRWTAASCAHLGPSEDQGRACVYYPQPRGIYLPQ